MLQIPPQVIIWDGKFRGICALLTDSYQDGKRIDMFFNVVEDFKKRTLTALPTLLEKLAYISSLQSGDGRYIHWGLSRSFGDYKAQKGISAIHAELAMKLIRLPIRGIYRDYRNAAEKSDHPELLSPESFSLKAPSNGDELLSSHLRLIQDSLVAVAEQPPVSDHRVA